MLYVCELLKKRFKKKHGSYGCADSRCRLFIYVLSPSPALLNRCGNFPIHFQRLSGAFQSQQDGFISLTNVPVVYREVTFNNVAVNRASELLSGLLVEVLAVDDPHLFEESRLAALASA
uniref:Uncharacterized protein n=1 Tax=Seriola dumerili TaxID=41447 RepID=A0A3B4ULW2_SERDU